MSFKKQKSAEIDLKVGGQYITSSSSAILSLVRCSSNVFANTVDVLLTLSISHIASPSAFSVVCDEVNISSDI